MSKIGLFYASSTGNTEDVAKKIQERMGEINIKVELQNVADCTNNKMEEYEYIIIGVSTWGEGDLQDDWDDYFPFLDNLDFSTKTVALFGLGDQEEYCDFFLDGMGIIYDKAVEKGAKVVGSWPTDGYEFDESKAVRNEEFVGLALDEDNQDDLSDERISEWIEQIKPFFTK